ncbi:MAG: dethiobiotin synthase, partial [Phycisphaerae bacterium]
TGAAARRGAEVALAPVWEAWGRLREAHEVLLVEGIGGILCPVTPATSVADFAKEFALPILVVARSGLGSINHTALAVEAARSRGLAVAGVVINRYNHESPDLAEMTSPDEIRRVTGVEVLGLVPEDRATDFAAGVVGPEVLAAVRQLPLARLFG